MESVLIAPITRGDPKSGPQPYGHLPSRPDALTYDRLKTCGPAEPPGFNGVLAPYAKRGGQAPAPPALSLPASEDNSDNIRAVGRTGLITLRTHLVVIHRTTLADIAIRLAGGRALIDRG